MQQLENNEAILLMFLAGELPPEDHAEVEQMVRTDANLRAQLDRLRITDDALRAEAQGEAQADVIARPMRVREAALVRDTGRMIRQWQVDRARVAAAEADTAPREAAPRSRWWLYPAAAAAVAAVVFMALWGGPGEITNVPPDVGNEQLVAEYLENIEEETLPRAERLVHLDEAESQVAALDALTSSNSVLWDNVNEQNR